MSRITMKNCDKLSHKLIVTQKCNGMLHFCIEIDIYIKDNRSENN